MDKKALKEKVKTAPAGPGCYLFTDQYGNIMYVGKAKNLRSRVRSYFSAAAKEDERIEDLVPRIVDVEYRETDTELNALLLEHQLIKQIKPWFNSAMKADKPRPYLRLAVNSAFPGLSVATERADDGAEYYDFFTDSDEIRGILGLFAQVWHTPQCGKDYHPGNASPCIYYSMGTCMAPCAGRADESTYGMAIHEIRQLLVGVRVNAISELEQSMQQCAEDLAFEKAENYRKMREGLCNVCSKSSRLHHYPDGKEVLLLIRPHGEYAFSVFWVVGSSVAGRADYPAVPLQRQFEETIVEWQRSATPVPGGDTLAKALIDVAAAKQFIVLPQNGAINGVYKAIEAFANKKKQG